MKPRILIIANVDWSFWSHRLPIAKALLADNWNVTVAATVERGYDKRIEAEGLQFVPLHFRRGFANPISELKNFWELIRLYYRIRPDLVLHVAIKPVLYGSLAAKLTKVPTVLNAITGLGYTFLEPGIRGRLINIAVTLFYRISLSGSRTRVLFENPDDKELFLGKKLGSRRNAFLIRGVGVDLCEYQQSPEPPGVPIVLLASRLLWDKGVGEFVDAARLLVGEKVAGRFVLVGDPDPYNPRSISSTILKKWQAEGIVEWWGLRDDMPSILRQSAIVVLPSYREGVPRILLEAAASGRPIVTTDVPGCREVVRNGENGFLVPMRDSSALAKSIKKLIDDPLLRRRMGARSRSIAEAEFSEDMIVGQTVALLKESVASN
jgi:glycosyltransferase involved in cell wall biosynthesis